MKSKKNTVTPLIHQYQKIKEDFKDTLLFFQVGDFFELFFDDAKRASSFLGITLTKRGNINGEPIPLCGVPVHAKDHYISKLIRGGFKVAVCEQLSEPVAGKVVDRGVTNVYTPGTLTDSTLLDDKSASYLFSFYPTKDQWGVVFAELLTAQLFATILPNCADKKLEAELVRFFPDEILVPNSNFAKPFHSFFKKRGYFTTIVDLQAQQDNTNAWLQQQFNEQINKKIIPQVGLYAAFQNFYMFLKKNQEHALKQFNTVSFYAPDDFLIMDSATQRNLELVKNNQDGSRKNTLFSVIDRASTSMGSRMIKKWIQRPLIKQKMIVQRQDAVSVLIKNTLFSTDIEKLLTSIGDIERVIGRIGLNRATLADYVTLTNMLEVLPQVKSLLKTYDAVALMHIINSYIINFENLFKLLKNSLNDDPSKDWKIKNGFDQQLDHLRSLVENARSAILKMERAEQEATKISSLKIRFNKIHGYFIEVTKPNLSAVPDRYILQQTLVNRSRFITKQLQVLQHEILQAKSEIDNAEKMVFERIKKDVFFHLAELRKVAHALAHLDGLLGLAQVAYDNNYSRPDLNTQRVISITDGRHPVIEQSRFHSFIPNHTCLDDNESVWIITGPNMGGKSTYLRQVALISILAHIGSFVPAKSANIAILDRIFTRIGAGDNLAEGKSTFLVEMEETATICTQATKNSLVILDEVGRGTSTFDGLAIAQAVIEHIYKVIQTRCLFATHYHELTNLTNLFPGIASYFTASKKTKEGIIFLYKIVKGVADGSFGVEVAKLAQLPESIINRSQDIINLLHAKELYNLQNNQIKENVSDPNNPLMAHNKRLCKKIEELELKLEKQSKQLANFSDLDFDELSPRRALEILWSLQEKQ